LRTGRMSILNNIVLSRTIAKISMINSQPAIHEMTEHSIVSTGHLPPVELVTSLVAQAHDRFKSITEGKVADYIPALAQVSADLFGICIVETNGNIYTAGDADYEFSIQSVSKPFVFALICHAIGEDVAREKLGVRSTGLPFNSVIAIERMRARSRRLAWLQGIPPPKNGNSSRMDYPDLQAEN
jgi:hypothetical protein